MGGQSGVLKHFTFHKIVAIPSIIDWFWFNLQCFDFFVYRTFLVDFEGQKQNQKYARIHFHVNGEFMATTQGKELNFTSKIRKRTFFNSRNRKKLIIVISFSCICGEGSKCTMAEENLSLASYIFRCVSEVPATTAKPTSTSEKTETNWNRNCKLCENPQLK